MWLWFHKLASPPYAYSVATKLRPWLLWISIALMLYGSYTGLFVVPADYQQKDSARIMYVHFPVGVWSQGVYAAMAIAAGVGLIWRMKTYGAFVWACYGTTAAVFVFNYWLARRRHALELKALQRRMRSSAF